MLQESTSVPLKDDLRAEQPEPRGRPTIHVQPGLVGDGAGPVGRRAGVGAAVLRPHAGDVDVADHRAAHAHVLAHDQPVGEGR